MRGGYRGQQESHIRPVAWMELSAILDRVEAVASVGELLEVIDR